MDKEQLSVVAAEMRRAIIEMLGKSKSGHPGGSLSLAEIVATLYFHTMNYDFKNPKKEDRDYLILSKGHAAPVIYAAMAIGGGIPKQELMTLRQLDSRLQGHPDKKRLPFVEASTGSLGQGFSVAGGLAMSLKLNKKPNRVFAILGDGELDEGLIWEAAMSAAHYKLDNLIAIVDNNGLQIDGANEKVMDLGDIGAKFSAFGFEVFHIDGHDIDAIIDALDKAIAVQGKPAVIIAKTVKGKGVSFMENNAAWHGAAMSEEDFLNAREELE